MLESLVSLASSNSSADASNVRQPRALQGVRSFPRLEPTASSPLSRSRAATLEGSAIPEHSIPNKVGTSPDSPRTEESTDVFDKKDGDNEEEDDSTAAAEWMNQANDLPAGFDELPIELISLTDRFIESLSAKVYPHPPSVENLSTLFQEFYVTAASRISTHISTLSSRQNRQRSPVPSASSRSSSLAKPNGRGTSTSSKEKANSLTEQFGTEQQMLTSSEITDRRNARKLLERKRVVLEEAVERRACEGVYDRIWRHRSSNDEEQDEKLRSKTAALALVGIGLRDLGIGVDAQGPEGAALKEEDIREWLTEAKDELIKMNDDNYPLGKLSHLKAAHKNIVDSLSRFYPSSSSADEILPTLIYTLITTPPEGINIISNLLFIQRFRMLSKVDGEAAYCLTNLEAAISFLETVDLASLRADEAPTGSLRATNGPSTSNTHRSDHLTLGKVQTFSSTSPGVSASSAPSSTADASASLTALSELSASSQASARLSPLHQRRLSSLLQAPTNHFGAASDAVMNTADLGLRTVNSTLENSYRFLFGRLKERQLDNPALEGENQITVPKTLDEARKLIGNSPLSEISEIDNSAGWNVPTFAEKQVGPSHNGAGDSAMGYFTGPQMSRDRSLDSTTSGHSAKRVNFAEDKTATRVPSGPSGSPAVESMRNLGNTLNPLNRLAGMNVMRPFSRSASNTPPTLASPGEPSNEVGAHSAKPSHGPAAAGLSSSNVLPIVSASDPQRSVQRAAPPIQRFMELESPGDLRLGEVLELLRDYRRLAGALKDSGAFL